MASFQECELRVSGRFCGKEEKKETAKGRLRAVEKGRNCPFGSKDLVTASQAVMDGWGSIFLLFFLVSVENIEEIRQKTQTTSREKEREM